MISGRVEIIFAQTRSRLEVKCGDDPLPLTHVIEEKKSTYVSCVHTTKTYSHYYFNFSFFHQLFFHDKN